MLPLILQQKCKGELLQLLLISREILDTDKVFWSRNVYLNPRYTSTSTS